LDQRTAPSGGQHCASDSAGRAICRGVWRQGQHRWIGGGGGAGVAKGGTAATRAESVVLPKSGRICQLAGGAWFGSNLRSAFRSPNTVGRRRPGFAQLARNVRRRNHGEPAEGPARPATGRSTTRGPRLSL